MIFRMNRLLIHGAIEIVQIVTDERDCLTVGDMANPSVLKNSAGLSLLVDADGKIGWVGSDAELKSLYDGRFPAADEVIDATGMCLLPGLVDSHTHPVWAGDRVGEFEMKVAGKTYMEIHQAGGGIHFTVEHTRRASEAELREGFHQRAQLMLQSGTTLLEAKSGYGLDVESELKMLRAIEGVRGLLPLEISATFCGGHAVPKGKTSAEAVRDVVDRQIPALKAAMECGQVSVEAIDVFCESGVFSLAESREMLVAGRRVGLALNFHGDELHPTRSAEMGAELKAEAISHLEEISDDGVKAMAEARSVAIVLPTTADLLRLKPPPVRKMIDAGVIVALGSDFNPNCYCLSMPMVMYSACLSFRMSLSEALVAATLNGAKALGRGQTHGALAVGRVGDLLVVDAPRWQHLIYQHGCQQKLIRNVVKEGRIVVTRPIHFQRQY